MIHPFIHVALCCLHLSPSSMLGSPLPNSRNPVNKLRNVGGMQPYDVRPASGVGKCQRVHSYAQRVVVVGDWFSRPVIRWPLDHTGHALYHHGLPTSALGGQADDPEEWVELPSDSAGAFKNQPRFEDELGIF